MKKVAVCSLIIFLSFSIIGCVSNRAITVDVDDKDDKEVNTIELTGADQARRSAQVSGYISDIKEDELYNAAMKIYYKKLEERIGNSTDSDALSEVGFSTSFSNETRDDLFVIVEKDGTIKRQWKFDLRQGETQYRDFFPDRYIVYAFRKVGHGSSSLHSIGKLRVWPLPIGETDEHTVHGQCVIYDQ